MSMRSVATAVACFLLVQVVAVAPAARAQEGPGTAAKTLQQALDEPFTAVLRSCLAGEPYDRFKRSLARKFGRDNNHAIPRKIAEQHESSLSSPVIIHNEDLSGLFYSFWSGDAQAGYRPLTGARFDARKIESTGDLTLGGLVSTRHLFDCSSVVAAAVNADVKLPTAVIEAALKNSYSFNSAQNAGISLLYARFNSRVPEALSRETTIDANDVFHISLSLWRAYRTNLSQGSSTDTSKLHILKSLEGFAVNTKVKYQTGFETKNDIAAGGGMAFLKAHGSVTLNSEAATTGSSTDPKFITTRQIENAEFFPAPLLADLVKSVARSGEKLISRDAGFPTQLGGNSIDLPYRTPLPQGLCDKDLVMTDDGSPVKTEWIKEPIAYCRVVRTFNIGGEERTTQSRVSTEFKMRLKYAADTRTPDVGDVVFSVDGDDFIDNPNASLRAQSVPERTRLEIKDIFVEGTIGLRIATSSPVVLTTAPPVFMVTGRCEETGSMESVEQTSAAERVGTSNVWLLRLKLAVSNAGALTSQGGRCMFDTLITVVRQGSNAPISFNAETVQYRFEAPTGENPVVP
jgi:hypothetical protein